MANQPVVLVAVSEQDMVKLYERTLQRQGYRVETASCGVECLSKLREVQPVALVLDDELTWGGSDEVLEMLREAYDLPPTPTILVSQPPLSAGQLPAPVVSRLEKPFHLRDLIDSVCQATMQIVPAGV